MYVHVISLSVIVMLMKNTKNSAAFEVIISNVQADVEK